MRTVFCHGECQRDKEFYLFPPSQLKRPGPICTKCLNERKQRRKSAKPKGSAWRTGGSDPLVLPGQSKSEFSPPERS